MYFKPGYSIIQYIAKAVLVIELNPDHLLAICFEHDAFVLHFVDAILNSFVFLSTSANSISAKILAFSIVQMSM